MKIGLVVASLLAVVVQSLYESGSIFSRVGHHIEEFKVRKLAPPPVHLQNALDERISLHIATRHYFFDLDLTLNQFIYADDSKIYSSRKDEKGDPIELEKEYRSYQGNATIRTRGFSILNYNKEQAIVSSDMVSVTFYTDNRAMIVVVTPDNIFTIDRIEVHQESKEIQFDGENKHSGMSLVRLSDIGESNITPFHKSIMQSSTRKRLSPAERRKLIIVFDNCWPGQTSFDRVASIGIVVDNRYYCKVVTGSDSASCQVGDKDSMLLADLQSIINAASNVYSQQFNVHLRLGTVFLGTNASSVAPNNSSCPVMSNELNGLKTWRAKYYSQHSSTDSNAVFHLFTNCHPPPGMVGLAFIGVLCEAASGYSSAVVNRVWSTTWLTFAHECGHNFGMTHSFENGVGTTGGIMDYGNGMYQGVYQFEPGKKPEVCQELTSVLSTTHSGFIPISRCLPQFNEGTIPVPTSQPTNRPTLRPTTQAPNPTKRPTSKPTVRPTNRPTRRPTSNPTRRPSSSGPQPTRRPTPRPTSKPTYRPTNAPTSVRYYARWYHTGVFGACYPSCGSTDSYATELLKCCASNLNSTNQCSWEIDVSYCDPATKPSPNSQKCTNTDCPDPNAKCGNGVLDSGEYCDPSLNDCCVSNCTGFKVTNACVQKNTVVDAAFTDRDGHVYIFQGPYFTRYANFKQWYSHTPDAGYPKTIKGNFPLQQCTHGIGGDIVARQSNQLFVFCQGLSYVKVDLDNQIQLAGQFNAATDWNLPQDFINCGQVTAALGLTYSMMLFCRNIWVSVPYTRTTTSSDVLQIHSVTEFGFTLQNGYIVTALMYDRSSGYWAWFQGPQNYVTMQAYDLVSDVRQTDSIFNGSTVSDIATLEGQGGCYQDSCSNCVSGVCQSCVLGYLLYGSKCFNDSVLAYLQCDQGSQSDANLVDGGFPTLFQHNYTTGVSGNAIEFDGQTKLQMKPLNRNVTDFSISAYFKPKSLNQATFVSIDNSFVFSYQSVDNSSFQVVVDISGFQFTCYVASPMKLHQWNKIQVMVKDSIIWTGANGFFHMRAFDDTYQGLNLQLQFNNWSIGADHNGIDGSLDEFILVDESSSSSSSSSTSSGKTNSKTILGLQVWQIALIAAAAGVVLIAIIALIIYKVKHRRVLKEQLPETLEVNFA